MIIYPKIKDFPSTKKMICTQHDFKDYGEEGKAIIQHTSDYPTLRFMGYVKLHGTNGAIVKYKDQEGFKFQSRSHEITTENDNAGFVNYLSKESRLDFFEEYCKTIAYDSHIALFGEFCGGNIQKGIALNQLPKMFVAFGLNIDDKWYCTKLPFDNNQGMYSTNNFKTYLANINFNEPEIAVNEIVKLTKEVESQCPVSKDFGKEGYGEGIVWTSVNSDGTEQLINFKTVGKKHTESKTKQLVEVDLELVNSCKEFVEIVVTENRLNKGLQYMKEMNLSTDDMKNVKAFMDYIVKDIREEEMDRITESNLDPKLLYPKINEKAKKWYINNR